MFAMKNKYNLLILILLAINGQMNAQSAVVAAGNDAKSTSGSVAYSVGQVMYAQITGEDGSIYMGVQQPAYSIQVGTHDEQVLHNVSLYPNPARGEVFLQIDESDMRDVK